MLSEFLYKKIYSSDIDTELRGKVTEILDLTEEIKDSLEIVKNTIKVEIGVQVQRLELELGYLVEDPIKKMVKLRGERKEEKKVRIAESIKKEVQKVISAVENVKKEILKKREKTVLKLEKEVLKLEKEVLKLEEVLKKALELQKECSELEELVTKGDKEKKRLRTEMKELGIIWYDLCIVVLLSCIEGVLYYCYTNCNTESVAESLLRYVDKNICAPLSTTPDQLAAGLLLTGVLLADIGSIAASYYYKEDCVKRTGNQELDAQNICNCIMINYCKRVIIMIAGTPMLV